MIEFNLILKAAGKPTSAAMFWKLLGGTVMMLAFGYLGEIGALLAWPAFAGGMLGWFFILFEIFNGEAGGTAFGCSPAVASSFSTMRLIVTVGWSIYPLGYLFGYLLGAVDQVFLNVIYNIADFSTRSLSCSRAGLQPRVTLRPRERLCWVEQAHSERVLRLLSAAHFSFLDFLELPFFGHAINV